MFVTVYGFRNSSYSILASYANSFRTPTILSQGQPQADNVRASSYQYYSFSAHYEHGYTSDQWVTTSVQSQQGDPDLYVKIYETAAITDTTEAPSKTSFDYKAIAWHSDELNIPSPNDECDTQCGSEMSACTCVINIAVYGASGQVGVSNSSYTIVASGSTSLDPDSVEQLQSGISREHTIVNVSGWAYFMFTVNDPEVDVTISVQPTYVMFLENNISLQIIKKKSLKTTGTEIRISMSFLRMSRIRLENPPRTITLGTPQIRVVTRWSFHTRNSTVPPHVITLWVCTHFQQHDLPFWLNSARRISSASPMDEHRLVNFRLDKARLTCSVS